jgi:hypothetical protein
MKTPLFYGCLSAFGGAVLTLLVYFAGFHDTVEKLPTAQLIVGVAGIAIFITCLALTMRDKRAQAAPGSEWGYGSALGAGVLMSVFSVLLGCIFNYLYFTVINPHMSDLIFAAQQAKMEEKGMSADQIAKAEPIMRKMMSPAVTTLIQLIGGFIISVLISLIVAIFFREPRASVEIVDVPPSLP